MMNLMVNMSPDRIVGGAYTNITFLPFMVSLMINGQHMCGGGILNKHWILTAAHCATVILPRQSITQVRSGSSYLEEGGVFHDVSHVYIHENFNSATNDYDIALLMVSPPFKYSDSTRPLMLANNASVDTNLGLVGGWGYFLDLDPVLSRQLQYVLLPKVDKQTCREDYSGKYEVPNSQVCYGFRGGGKDTCKGDSGGPMVNLDYTLIGVTSWGDGCAEAYRPGVYTDCVLLRDWIREKVADYAD